MHTRTELPSHAPPGDAIKIGRAAPRRTPPGAARLQSGDRGTHFGVVGTRDSSGHGGPARAARLSGSARRRPSRRRGRRGHTCPDVRTISAALLITIGDRKRSQRPSESERLKPENMATRTSPGVHHLRGHDRLRGYTRPRGYTIPWDSNKTRELRHTQQPRAISKHCAQ